MSGSKFPPVISPDDDDNRFSITSEERYSALKFHYVYILSLLAIIMIGVAVSNQPLGLAVTVISIGGWIILALIFAIDLRKLKSKNRS